MKRVLWLITIISVVLVGCLEAARPFATDDAGIVEQNGCELELGGDFWEEQASLSLGFKHGLTERMDIGVGFGYTVKPDETKGFGQAELGLKFALMPDLFAVSITGGLGDTPYNLNGIITYCFGPIEIDGNIGYEATGIEGQTGTAVYALALIFELEEIAVGAEASGNEDDLNAWLIGIRYEILEGFAVDCGISGGFESGAGNVATTGLHYEF